MEKISYRNTGKQVRNKKSGEIGIAATGSERIEPKVICTHDNWNTLELVEERIIIKWIKVNDFRRRFWKIYSGRFFTRVKRIERGVGLNVS